MPDAGFRSAWRKRAASRDARLGGAPQLAAASAAVPDPDPEHASGGSVVGASAGGGGGYAAWTPAVVLRAAPEHDVVLPAGGRSPLLRNRSLGTEHAQPPLQP